MTHSPYVFILAGGRGTRLWPLSAEEQRKPFVKLFGGKSLLELTLERVAGFVPLSHVRIVTAQELRQAVVQTAPDFPESQILCEPQGRNTAAALAFTCGHLLQVAPDAVAVVLPADHMIQDTTTFQTELAEACQLAKTRQEIVTLGIQPTHPATAYGYIACGEAIEVAEHATAYVGAGFTEKPDLATAKTYLTTGSFLWNAGIFVWTAQTLRARFAADAPVFLPLIDAPEAAETHYAVVPNIAFDYAIMEHCPSFAVVRGTFDWDDVGTFEALERHVPQVEGQNRVVGEVTLHQTHNCTVLSTQGGHRVVLSGVENLLVAQTPAYTLICPRGQATAIQKQLTEEN
jgi:mannose-1-phosphate guanylyltransferase